MKFRATSLPGVFVIVPDKSTDERGHFARLYAKAEFARHGIAAEFATSAVSYNKLAGTLRGLHYQTAPFAEAKLVSCPRGRAWDVVVDLRAGSPSYGRWTATEISAANGRAVFVPEGCAHGFQTLVRGTAIAYQLSSEYQADFARGVRWDDPDLAIEWPYAEPAAISERDKALPRLRDLDPPALRRA